MRIIEALNKKGALTSGQVWTLTQPANGRHVSERQIVNILEDLEGTGWVRRREFGRGERRAKRRTHQPRSKDDLHAGKIDVDGLPPGRKKWIWSLEAGRSMVDRRLPPAFGSILSDVIERYLGDLSASRRMALVRDLAGALMDRPKAAALSKRERRALAFVQVLASLCRPYRDVVAIDQLLGKMEQAFGAPSRSRRLSSLFAWKPRQADELPRVSAILDAVVTTVENGKALYLAYRGVRGGKSEKRLVSVQLFLRWDHLLYLVVWDHGKKALRTLALTRCEGWSASDAKRVAVDEGQLTAFVEKPFGVFEGGEAEGVSILFSAAVARYAEEVRWHPTQTMEATEGGVRLQMTVPVTDDLVGWILRFQGEAVPESPDGLVDRVEQAAEKMAAACRARRPRKKR